MEFIINPPITQIFFSFHSFTLRYYGLVICFAILIGLYVAYNLFLKKYSKIEADFFIDYIPYIVFLAIFGARLFYVVGNLKFYLLYKKEIFLINHGGLSIWGAILFGLVGIVLYLRFKRKNVFSHLDIIAVSMPLSQAIGRFGNYFNQEAFGLPSNSFLKLFVDKPFRPHEYANYSYFHPTFLYESFLDIILFAILLFVFIKMKNIKQGTVFYLYIIFYSIIRIFVEFFRIDSVAYLFGIPIASFISIIMLLASLFLITKLKA